MLNNFYLKFKKNDLKLLSEHSNFQIVPIKFNEYFIEAMFNNKRLGIDKNNKIKLYNKKENSNIDKAIWNIIKIRENQYFIYNK